MADAYSMTQSRAKLKASLAPDNYSDRSRQVATFRVVEG